MDWEALRLFGHVVEEGSIRGGARALGIDASTASRRLRALETELGVRLLERTRDGVRPTPAGQEMQLTAASVAQSTAGLARRIARYDDRLAGMVTVGTSPVLGWGLVVPALAELQTATPALHVDLRVSDVVSSLHDRTLDITVRATLDPPDTLVGYRLGVVRMAEYGTVGAPSLSRFETGEATRLRSDATLLLARAVQCGFGRARLPVFLGESMGLPQLSHSEPLPSDWAVWVLTHPDLRRVRRVRDLLARLRDALAAHPGTFGSP